MPSSRFRSRDYPVSLGVLAWYVLLAIWLTWAPYDFSWPHTGAPSASTPGDFIGNAFLLTPLGLAIGVTSIRRPVIMAVGLGLTVSATIELGQLFLPGRVTSLVDLLLNTSGAAIAGWVARASKDGVSSRPSLLILMGVPYVALVVYVASAHVTLKSQMQLRHWNPGYMILAGAEVGVDRDYLGIVDSTIVCGGAEELVCGVPHAHEQERRRLVERVESSQHLVVQASVESASDRQGGPARIVSFSRGAYLRNFTIGQEGEALVIRLRTPRTGLNGTGMELIVPKALPRRQRTWIQVSFHSGDVEVRMRHAEGHRQESFHFDGLAASLLWAGAQEVTPDQLALMRGITALLLVLPPLAALPFLMGRVFATSSTPASETANAQWHA